LERQNPTIPISNYDLPSTSSSTRSTATTTPADDLLMEQGHLLQNRATLALEQHGIETNANGKKINYLIKIQYKYLIKIH
jgi:hypothetical protein